MAAAAFQVQRLFLTASTSSTTSSWTVRRPRRRSTAAPCRAALRVPSGLQTSSAAATSPAAADLTLKLDWIDARVPAGAAAHQDGSSAAVAVEKLRAVAEAAADRAEMHDIIGRQRDNWNHLLLHSTNSLTLAASVMAALAPAAPGTVGALKASVGALLATAAVTMAAVNKIQPSQLAEEQRNATRLWRQLERDLRAALGVTFYAAAPANFTSSAGPTHPVATRSPVVGVASWEEVSRVAPGSPRERTARCSQPGSEETQEIGVSPGPGHCVVFGSGEPGSLANQRGKHGRLHPASARPP